MLWSCLDVDNITILLGCYPTPTEEEQWDEEQKQQGADEADEGIHGTVQYALDR